MDLQSKIIRSFCERAAVYENKTTWVNLPECIDPLVPLRFGEGKALDICSGTGAITKELFQADWNVTSIDISKSMLMQNHFPFQIIGDMHFLPFPDNYFDIVVCRQGLQYADIPLALQEFIRVGKSLIKLAHITKETEDKFSFWEEYFLEVSPGRKHIFTPGYISNIVTSLGLSIINLKVFRQQDYYLGPLLHLSNTKKEKIIGLLLNTAKEFKLLYNVKINKDITYSNRWEFLDINIQS